MSPSIPHSLPRLLSRCADLRDLRNGSSLHAHAIKMGSSHADNFLGNGIVNLYARCRQSVEASLAFEEIENRDVGSWNCLINSYSQQGVQESCFVLELFRRMRGEAPDIAPNSFTFTGVFTAVSQLLDLGAGKEAHAVAIKTENCGDVFVGTSLVSMYCRMGVVTDARVLFDRMPDRNFVSWAAMISGYADEKDGAEAFRLFRSMLGEGECCVNEFVITSVLSAFSLPEFSKQGEQIHCHAVKNGLLSFVPVKNALITMYAKCGLLDDALWMFESSDNRNWVTWSAMVTGFAQNGDSCEALRLFSEMHASGIMPTEYTFVGVLNACSDCAALIKGKQVHVYLLKLGSESQLYIKSSLVDMYAKCGTICDARKGFDQNSEPDVVLWTTMIAGYVQNGENEEALNLYGQMGMARIPPNDLTLASALRACSSLAVLDLGKQIQSHAIKYGFNLDAPIGSALSTMYAKCGDLSESYCIFRRMPVRDIVAWNSIISGFAQNGCGNDALKLFDEMKIKGIEPNHITFINLLSACSHMGLVERGWTYFRSMSNDYGLTPSVEHYACMVDILSRAGLLDEAKSLIESAPLDHGICLWRILLGACMNYRKFDLGAYAGERLMELGTQDSSAYILLSNIYVASGRREKMEEVRRMMRFQGVIKEPGCSWIEVNNRVHVFLVRDQLHPDITEIYSRLRKLTKHMKDEGYQPSTGSSIHCFENSDKEFDDNDKLLQMIPLLSCSYG